MPPSVTGPLEPPVLGGDEVDLVPLARAAGLAVGDGTDVGLVVQVRDASIVAASSRAQDILGLSLDQMLGRVSQDPRWAAVDEAGVALSAEDHPATVVLRTGVRVTGAVVGVHRPGRDAAGRHVWLGVDAAPCTTPGGMPGVVVALRLLAGRRAAELQRAELVRLYRFLVESATDMVAWQLPDTTFLWVSPAWVSTLGWSAAELVGHRATDFVHPGDVAAARVGDEVVAGTDRTTERRVRVRHRDGHHVWTEVVGRVVRDSDGSVAELRTAWRDVTARVEAERERDAAQALVRSAVDSSPVGIALRRVDGPIVEVNPALCAMLRRPAEDLVGRSLIELVHPDDDHDDGAAALLAGDVVHHESERRYLRGDGTWMWGHRSAVRLRDEVDRPAHLLIHLQDVTERRTTADALARAALQDPLTGLANRTVLTQRLRRSLAAAASTSRGAVLFIDLDGFKTVNDTRGHDAGDELLRQVAGRLQDSVRDGDLVARLGGDEFVVLCDHVHDHDGATDIARRVVAAIAQPFVVHGEALTVSASVGVTVAEGRSASAVLTRADAAMYRAKRSGRGRVELDG